MPTCSGGPHRGSSWAPRGCRDAPCEGKLRQLAGSWNRGHEGPECCDELGAGPGTRMSSPVLPKRPQNPTAGTESARVTDSSSLERGLAQSISPFGGV